MEKEKNEKDLNDCDFGCDCGCDLGCDCGDDACHCNDNNCDCGDNCHCGDDDCECGDECACEEVFAHCSSHHKESKKGSKKQACCSEKCPGKAVFGLLVLAFGVLYLGKNLAWWSFNMNWSVFWPIVIIICGLMIIVKSRRK